MIYFPQRSIQGANSALAIEQSALGRRHRTVSHHTVCRNKKESHEAECGDESTQESVREFKFKLALHFPCAIYLAIIFLVTANAVHLFQISSSSRRRRRLQGRLARRSIVECVVCTVCACTHNRTHTCRHVRVSAQFLLVNSIGAKLMIANKQPLKKCLQFSRLNSIV